MQHVQHHLLIPGLSHILVKQGAVWLQYRISPLIFSFLLVYVTDLTLHRCNAMWLPGAQAAILESYSKGWQRLAGDLPSTFPPPLVCVPGVLLVSPWGLWAWMGQEGSTTCREGLRRDDTVVWREACPSGAMHLSRKAAAPELKHVSCKP